MELRVVASSQTPHVPPDPFTFLLLNGFGQVSRNPCTEVALTRSPVLRSFGDTRGSPRAADR